MFAKLAHRAVHSLDHAVLVYLYAFLGEAGAAKLDVSTGWHGATAALIPAALAAAHKVARTYGAQDSAA